MNPLHAPERTLLTVLVAGVLGVGVLAYGGTEAVESGDREPEAGAVDHPTAQAASASGRMAGEGHGAHTRGLEATDPTAEGSVYVLGGAWSDQHGGELTLAELAGRPRVVAMVYTHCSFACPRIIAQMKRIEAAFAGAPAGESPGFVLVSIDPERDTPERLATFAESSRLDPGSWTLLNGSDAQILELSVLLGVKYRATGDGEFAHSNVLTVLDAEGAVVERVEGLGAEVGPAVEALEAELR